MSQKYPTELEQGQINFHCKQCDVPPGQWCVTARGNLSTYIHTVRGTKKLPGGYLRLLPLRDDDPVDD